MKDLVSLTGRPQGGVTVTLRFDGPGPGTSPWPSAKGKIEDAVKKLGEKSRWWEDNNIIKDFAEKITVAVNDLLSQEDELPQNIQRIVSAIKTKPILEEGQGQTQDGGQVEDNVKTAIIELIEEAISTSLDSVPHPEATKMIIKEVVEGTAMWRDEEVKIMSVNDKGIDGTQIVAYDAESFVVITGLDFLPTGEDWSTLQVLEYSYFRV